MCRAKNLNRKNDYGLDNKQMMRLINAHRKGDAYKRALIEFRLTDINFHREVEMLMNGKYDELKEEVKESAEKGKQKVKNWYSNLKRKYQ